MNINGPLRYPPTMSEVNDLVAKAFGKRFVGNFFKEELDFDARVSEFTSSPSHIRLYIPIVSFFYAPFAGHFESKDGSSLYVLSKFRRQGEEYARLYKDLTGKKARLKVSYEEPLLNV